MNAHRVSTLAVLLTALTAAIYIIPAGTEVIDYGTLSPSDVPTGLAWIIAGLAALQLCLPDLGTEAEPIQPMDVLRAGLLFSTVLGMVWAMRHIGFLPASICIAAVAALLMRERRPVWLGLSAVGMPLLIWVVVTQLLDRTLP